jgi:hypothetical protein
MGILCKFFYFQIIYLVIFDLLQMACNKFCILCCKDYKCFEKIGLEFHMVVTHWMWLVLVTIQGKYSFPFCLGLVLSKIYWLIHGPTIWSDYVMSNLVWLMKKIMKIVLSWNISNVVLVVNKLINLECVGGSRSWGPNVYGTTCPKLIEGGLMALPKIDLVFAGCGT